MPDKLMKMFDEVHVQVYSHLIFGLNSLLSYSHICYRASGTMLHKYILLLLGRCSDTICNAPQIQRQRDDGVHQGVRPSDLTTPTSILLEPSNCVFHLIS